MPDQDAPPPPEYRPQISLEREGDLTLDDHEAIGAMLGRALPDHDHWFLGGRSWLGLQPELRVVARSGDVVVAHAGLRRVFVRVGDTERLVTSVGLVAVSPILQGMGEGTRLLAAVDEALALLGGHPGVVLAPESVTGFFTRAGWLPLESVTGGARTGHFSAASADGAGLRVSEDSGWLTRASSARASWPDGDLHWNSQLV
ncbi:GNAT family N-acetyltransferase [Frigoribacterium sp. 2-23]|uniref:GNAT family N-acetyltransferase n=1 Tax=Frigoribacterium sp. 2-23 TaxID=3415006 RepID=UPI003C6ED276